MYGFVLSRCYCLSDFRANIFQAIKCQGLDLDSLLPDPEMLMKIMVHPLQIQVYSNTWSFNEENPCVQPCIYISISVIVGVFIGDPQQHVGQERAADQRSSYDLRAVSLLQLHD